MAQDRARSGHDPSTPFLLLTKGTDLNGRPVDLVLGLDLVVALDGLGVSRGREARGPIAGALAAILRGGGGGGGSAGGGAVVRVAALEGLLGARLLRLLLAAGRGGLLVRRRLDEDVGHAAALAAVLARDPALVLLVVVGESGDDVPGVDQAGDLSSSSVN